MFTNWICHRDAATASLIDSPGPAARSGMFSRIVSRVNHNLLPSSSTDTLPPAPEGKVPLLRTIFQKGSVGLSCSEVTVKTVLNTLVRLHHRDSFDHLPGDPRRLRKWFMVMSDFDRIKATARSLIRYGSEGETHASGAYSEGEFGQIDRSRLIDVCAAADVIVVTTADGASVS
jgi:hypothetical protein